MNLAPIADKLQTEGLGTVGKDIFRRKMPERVNKALLVTAQTAVFKDPYVRGMHTGTFQIIARAPTEDEANALANSAIGAIEGYGQTLGTDRYRYILARHTPLLYPKSEADHVEASVNFDFVYTN